MPKLKKKENELPDKVLEAIDKYVKAYPKNWTHGICAGVCLNRKDGSKLNTWGSENGYACHAFIPSNNTSITINAHRANWQNINKELMLWIARESPFAHGVLNRDEEKQILNHASVLDSGLIGNGGALWVGKAFRHFVEDVWKVKFWEQLRNEGLNGLQAFIGADILTVDGNPQGYTHVSLFNYDTPANLRKFYDEMRTIERIDGREAKRGGPGSYSSSVGNEVWGSMQGKTVQKPDGWGGYMEVKQPDNVKFYVAQLKEIFEGDPKNVG